jgi:hypothetical protein
MPFRHIRLELARDKAHPEGDPNHFYEFTAPIGPDDHLDAQAWAANKALCTVLRQAPGEEAEHGHLVHSGKSWRFDYESDGADDDEPLFKLDRHLIRIGEYVSVTEWDGKTRTFKITKISPLIR